MSAPRRRIWLYPDGNALEIVLLGTLDEIGVTFALIKGVAERWPGFRGVEIICSGTTCGALRMQLTPAARSDDPVREGLAMMADVVPGLDERGMSFMVGVVGTW